MGNIEDRVCDLSIFLDFLLMFVKHLSQCLTHSLNKCRVSETFILQSELKFKHISYWLNFLKSQKTGVELECLKVIWDLRNVKQRHDLVRWGLWPVRNIFPEKMNVAKTECIKRKSCKCMCWCVSVSMYVYVCVYVCVRICVYV